MIGATLAGGLSVKYCSSKGDLLGFLLKVVSL